MGNSYRYENSKDRVYQKFLDKGENVGNGVLDFKSKIGLLTPTLVRGKHIWQDNSC